MWENEWLYTYTSFEKLRKDKIMHCYLLLAISCLPPCLRVDFQQAYVV